MLFLENEAQVNKNNYATMLFMSIKTSQSAKNELDPAKNKNRPKMSHTPFLHETLQLFSFLLPVFCQ